MFKRKHKYRLSRVVSVEGMPIALKMSIKYLGIEVNDYLIYKEHVSKAGTKTPSQGSRPTSRAPLEPRISDRSMTFLPGTKHDSLLYNPIESSQS